jgi:putative hydrolase of the HAD superfamily
VSELRAVVFDLDGTLLDHDAAALAGLRAWLPTVGARGDLEPYERTWFGMLDRYFPAARAGQITWAQNRELRMRDFAAETGLAILDPVVEARTYVEAYQGNWTAFPDAVGAVRQVANAGFVVGVLTNGEHEQQGAKLRAIGLAHLVDVMIASSTIQAGKPEVIAYQAVCARLAVDLPDAVMVGDNYDLDVLGARAAGMRAIHLDRAGGHPSPDDERVRSLADLRTALAVRVGG